MPPPLRKIVLAQVALGNPAVSPDGSHALYTRRSAQIQGYRRHVWVVPLDGGRARALTSGDVRDAAPQMTPQGDRVLFLRDEQVWAVPLEGGEAEQLTALPHGVSAFAQAPRGGRLALAVADPVPRFAVGPLAAGTPPLARVITRTDWRHDGDGYVDRHTHLFVQDARAGARARRLTRGDWSVESFAWSPDGKRIAFCADRGERADLEGRQSVHVVRARGGEPEELARLAGSCRFVSWSPDGAHVAFLGIDEAGEPYGCEDSLWIVPADGGSPRDLAHGRHLHLYCHGLERPRRLGGRGERCADLGRCGCRDRPADAGRAECGLALSPGGRARRDGRVRAARARLRGARRTHRHAALDGRGRRRSPPRRGRRPAPADARGLGLAAGADGDRLRAGLHPRPGRPDPRDGARAARRGSQGAAARALDRRRARVGAGAPSPGSPTGCSRPPVRAC